MANNNGTQGVAKELFDVKPEVAKVEASEAKPEVSKGDYGWMINIQPGGGFRGKGFMFGQAKAKQIVKHFKAIKAFAEDERFAGGKKGGRDEE